VKIDFCISFIGENAGILAEVFFDTLGMYCDLDHITFHLINKQVSERVWLKVIRSAEKLRQPICLYNLDTGYRPYKGSEDEFVLNTEKHLAVNDAAITARWCVDYCGYAEWCILSHFDVVWREDIIDWLKKKQSEYKAMMVGHTVQLCC